MRLYEQALAAQIETWLVTAVQENDENSVVFDTYSSLKRSTIGKEKEFFWRRCFWNSISI